MKERNHVRGPIHLQFLYIYFVFDYFCLSISEVIWGTIKYKLKYVRQINYVCHLNKNLLERRVCDSRCTETSLSGSFESLDKGAEGRGCKSLLDQPETEN